METKVLTYKIFLPAEYGGKYHTFDKITKVATCGNFLVDTSIPPIHVKGGQEYAMVHRIVCRRCLIKK